MPAAETLVRSLSRRFGRQPTRQWKYFDGQGELVGLVLRFDTGGGKTFRPLSKSSQGWKLEAMPAPRPLYDLPTLVNTHGPVWVVEGEKAADALRSLGLVATTSPGGANGARSADWSPLAGRDVTIWPDHDAPGETYAAAVAESLARLDPPAAVRVVRPEGQSAGEDAFDWCERHDAIDPLELGATLESLARAAAGSDAAGGSGHRTTGLSTEPDRAGCAGRFASGPGFQRHEGQDGRHSRPDGIEEPQTGVGVAGVESASPQSASLVPGVREDAQPRPPVLNGAVNFQDRYDSPTRPPENECVGREGQWASGPGGGVSFHGENDGENGMANGDGVSCDGAELVIHRASEVTVEESTWLWPGRIPAGKLTLLVGDPGLGKSMLTADIAARLTRGDRWPDGAAVGAAADVAFVLFEDGFADTTKPRLLRAGADCRRVYWIEGRRWREQRSAGPGIDPFDASRDVALLESLLTREPEIRLLIVDPLLAGMGQTDSHNYAEVQRSLNALCQFAERRHVAVLGIGHMNKASGSKAIYRSVGSVAYAAKARAVWQLGADPADRNRRLLLPAKMNLGPMPTGLAFSVDEGHLVWDAGPVEMTADALLKEESRGGPPAARETPAMRFLTAALEAGPRPAGVVTTEAEAEGLTPKQLRTALDRLGARRHRDGTSGHWWWSLADAEPRPTDDPFEGRHFS